MHRPRTVGVLAADERRARRGADALGAATDDASVMAISFGDRFEAPRVDRAWSARPRGNR